MWNGNGSKQLSLYALIAKIAMSLQQLLSLYNPQQSERAEAAAARAEAAAERAEAATERAKAAAKRAEAAARQAVATRRATN